MRWNLIEISSNSGKYNMEFDIELASRCKDNEAWFRLFRWQPYCISLGANQKMDDINIIKAEKDGIDIVKRPTGGRAILHAEEITYSVVLPVSAGLSSRQIYENISRALSFGLVLYNPKLKEAELETLQPDFPSLLASDSGMLCFASTAKSEVKFDGRKIIGSAQRKMNRAILQHGSVLCGKFHRKLPEYLNTADESIDFLKKEMDSKTIEIETILDEPIDYTRLAGCLVKGFEESMRIKFN